MKGGPTLSSPPSYDLTSFVASFEDLLTAYEGQIQNTGPRSFTIAGKTFTHIENTENFTLDGGDPDEVFTPIRIIKENYPRAYSFKSRITPVESALPFFWLGDTARNKILRAVQLHYQKISPSDVTREYTPMFTYLAGFNTGLQANRQFSVAKWAAQGDPEIATVLILRNGWTTRYPTKMAGNCLYTLNIRGDGIHLLIDSPHTYNDRFFAACSRAVSLIITYSNGNQPFDRSQIMSEAQRTFFSYGGFSASILPEYREYLNAELTSFVSSLDNILSQNEIPIIPQIEEPDPETCIPVVFDKNGNVKEYILKWKDFIIESSTDVQKSHIDSIAADKTLSGLLDAWKKLPNPKGSYTNAELTQYMNDRLLANARKRDYLIVVGQEGRKKYWTLNPKYERS